MPMKKEERNKKYYEANKEKIAERKKKYYQANKEKEAERKKKYYQANKEKEAECNKKYREVNKEKISEYIKKYRQTPNAKKSTIITKWKKRGIKTDNYDMLYNNYLSETHCDLCSVKFGKYGDGTGTFKCCDHNHETGMFRNFLCCKCNIKRG